MKYKVLIDGRLVSSSNSGISRYTKELIKGAIKYWGNDNVEIIFNRDNIDPSIGNYVVTKYRPFNLIDFLCFHRFLNKQNFDIFISPFYANSYLKKRNTKYISVVHDLMYRIVPSFFSDNWIINKLAICYYDIIVRRTLKNSDIVICVSKTTSGDVKRYFKINSEVFGEGINIIGSSESSPIETLSKYGLNVNDYFIYVGIDRPHKNVNFLCNAFIKANTDKKLVLCGKHAKQYNYPGVIQLGYVEDDELRDLYRAATAFIFPSKYEGFGLPILEALSLGTKVISSNAGSLKEFNDKFVKFFDPENEESLVRIMEEIDDFSINENKLSLYLSNYDWKSIIKRMMEFCENSVKLSKPKNY